MKPSEQNLERLLKKLIKQQPVSASEVLLHWTGLGQIGDRTLINTLNKQNGWEPFVLWSESEPEVRQKLHSISERPGISEAGLLVLKASGLSAGDTESPRSQSLWILQTVRGGDSKDWVRAFELMLQNEDFFNSTLGLLELEESAQTAHFFAKLLEQNLSREQDQAVRRTLYRLRQKGIEPPPVQKQPAVIVTEAQRPEIFLFAQNRMPLWQPFFYYRSTGPRGDWFFAEIAEGKTFEIIQQQRDIRLNQKRMEQIANNYAAEFRTGTGVDMPFRLVPAPHARYFLTRSFELVSGSEDFQKYMGEASIQNPFPDRGGLDSPADASMFMNHPYFQLWFAEEEFTDRLFQQLKEIDNAPILLPEHQTHQRKSETTNQSIQDYFSNKNRFVWRNALERAAYYLAGEPEISAVALGFADQLTSENFDPVANLFVKSLVERSLQVRTERMAREEQEQKKSSLIMSPQEFERSLKK